MSNTILYDPLLTAYLAEELDQRLKGRSCASSVLFAPDRSVTLPLDSGEALRMDLHPTRGWIRLVSRTTTSDELDALCTGVGTVKDERILHVRITTGDRFHRRERTLSIELHGNQWNAVLHEDGRIVNVLRGRQAGDRAIFPGEPYESPPPANRYGRDDGIEESEARATWHDRLAGFPPEQRAVELISRFAYTGSLNAGWILGAAGQRSATSEGSADELSAAFDRWWWLRGRPPAAPCVLRLERGSQPYPLPLTGLAHGPTSSLLEAMERVSSDLTPIRHPDPDLEAARAVIQRGRTATRRKLERLREELSEAGGAARIRETGDLLLARLGEVPRGADRVSLEDWTGEVVEIPLDPSLSPAENASKFYDEARRKARAGEQLPSLIRAAEDELRRWDDAAAALDKGEVPHWVAAGLASSDARPRSAGRSTEARPYRVFRTSGGLEVRVGRSSKDNDELTFRASSPNDVWLHARSVPGSHVILRWPHAEGSPPARDLAEAAQLAAVFSRARTSSTVAVDWTRRKYVRKPRGAAPGAVVPQRVRTLFVEPDEAAVRRLTPAGHPDADRAAP